MFFIRFDFEFNNFYFLLFNRSVFNFYSTPLRSCVKMTFELTLSFTNFNLFRADVIDTMGTSMTSPRLSRHERQYWLPKIWEIWKMQNDWYYFILGLKFKTGMHFSSIQQPVWIFLSYSGESTQTKWLMRECTNDWNCFEVKIQNGPGKCSLWRRNTSNFSWFTYTIDIFL